MFASSTNMGVGQRSATTVFLLSYILILLLIISSAAGTKPLQPAYVLLPTIDPSAYPASFEACQQKYGQTGCTSAIQCLNSEGKATACLPYCSSCVQPRGDEEWDDPTPFSTPISSYPTQIVCGVTDSTQCGEESCFYQFSQLDLAEGGPDPCQLISFTTQLSTLYSQHDCSYCDQQCAIKKDIPLLSQVQLLSDPTTPDLTPPASPEGLPTTYQCDRLKEFYPSTNQCQIQTIPSTAYCVQTQSLYTITVTSTPPTFEFNTIESVSTITHPDQCTTNPIANPEPNAMSFVYSPDSSCTFEWGCKHVITTQTGTEETIWDNKCSSCEFCGQDLSTVYTCRSAISAPPSSTVLYEYMSTTQLQTQSQKTKYCFDPELPSQTVPPADRCDCQYYCLSSVQLAALSPDLPQLNQSLPDEAYLLITENSETKCFIRPGQDMIPCGSNPVTSERGVYCVVNGVIVEESVCAKGYTDPASPAPQHYPTSLPPSQLIYSDLTAPDCQVQLLCKFGNDGELPISPATNAAYFTTPQSSPISSSKTYPTYYFPCDQAICNNICLDSIPIIVSKVCVKISGCIEVTDSSNRTHKECEYSQLPYSDPHCDGLDFTSVSTDQNYNVNQYQYRPALPSSTTSTPYSTFVTTLTCPVCTPTCINAPSATPITTPRPRPIYYTESDQPSPPPTALPTTVQDVSIYPCSPTTQQPDPYDLAQYGYTQIPLPTTDSGEPFATCYQAHIRSAVILNSNSNAAPQLIPVDQCTDYDPAQYTAQSPLNLDPRLIQPQSQKPFLCSTTLTNSIVQSIPVVSTQFTCTPAFLCASPDNNTDPGKLCTNTAADMTAYSPACTQQSDTCGAPISRSVSCVYSKNPSDDAMERFSVAEITSKLPSLVQSTFTSTPYQPHISMIQSLLQTTLFIPLANNCLTNPPQSDDVCSCEPVYYCAPQNTQLQPEASWASVLQPCFMEDMITERIDVTTNDGVGYPASCPACQNTRSEKVRDIFCRNRNGTFSYVLGEGGNAQPDTTSDCAKAKRQVPVYTKSCQGALDCNYDWRCPSITSSVTQDNWTPSIIYEPQCGFSSTFSRDCYVPYTAPTTPSEGFESNLSIYIEPESSFSIQSGPSTDETAFTASDGLDSGDDDDDGVTPTQIPLVNKVLVGGQIYIPSQCTSTGVKLRKVVCFAYTIDQFGKLQPISRGIQYDKTCSVRIDPKPSGFAILSNSSQSTISPLSQSTVPAPPSESTPCQVYTNCECTTSVYTGPQCSIPPSISALRMSTPYPQPTSLVGKNYIHVKSGTSMDIAWTYFGNPNNSIYFYLRLVSVPTTTVSTNPTPEDAPIPLNSNLSQLFLLGQVSAVTTSSSSSITSFSVPPVLSSVLSTSPYHLPATLAQLVAYLGFDAGSPLNFPFVGSTYLHILPDVVQCGSFTCTQANLQIYDVIKSTPSYDWSNSTDACTFVAGLPEVAEATDSPQSSLALTASEATVVEPTSVFMVEPNPSITGCSCVFSSTITTDATCTFSTACQSTTFSNIISDDLDNFDIISEQTRLTSTTHSYHRVNFNILSSTDDFYGKWQPDNTSSTRAQIGSPITLDPAGACGVNGFVPIQHRWSSVESVSLPPTCSPECQCFGEWTPESKCTKCSRTCNFPSDGGVLNSTTCTCTCNIGFYGDSCSLCATYALFTVEGITNQFISTIYDIPIEHTAYFQALAIKIASVLQLSADAVFIDLGTIYMRSNTLKFIVTISGNCASINSPSPLPTPEANTADTLYTTTPSQTSLFTIFPRWEALIQYYSSVQLNPNSISTTIIPASSASIAKAFIKTSPTAMFVVSKLNSILTAFGTAHSPSPSISQSIPPPSRRRSAPLFATTATSPASPTDPYYQFYFNSVFAQTGGKPTLSALYAPNCVGSACPTGDNPFDSVHCVLYGECIAKPDVDNRTEVLDDSVLYIVIAVVAFIIIVLVLGIIIFCCCSPLHKEEVPQPDDESTADSEDMFQHDSEPDALANSTSHHGVSTSPDESTPPQPDFEPQFDPYHPNHTKHTAPHPIDPGIDDEDNDNDNDNDNGGGDDDDDDDDDDDNDDDDEQYQHNMLHQGEGEVELVNF